MRQISALDSFTPRAKKLLGRSTLCHGKMTITCLKLSQLPVGRLRAAEGKDDLEPRRTPRCFALCLPGPAARSSPASSVASPPAV